MDHGNPWKLWVTRFDATNFCHILGWDDTLHLSRRKAEQRMPDFVESLHETRRPQEVWPRIHQQDPVTCHSKILHGHVLGVGSWTLVEDISLSKPMPSDFGLQFFSSARSHAFLNGAWPFPPTDRITGSPWCSTSIADLLLLPLGAMESVTFRLQLESVVGGWSFHPIS